MYIVSIVTLIDETVIKQHGQEFVLFVAVDPKLAISSIGIAYATVLDAGFKS